MNTSEKKIPKGLVIFGSVKLIGGLIWSILHAVVFIFVLIKYWPMITRMLSF